MSIESKLFFDFKKEFTELLASDVAEFYVTKDYETDLANYKADMSTEDVMKDGKVDYVKIKKAGKAVNNIRTNDIETAKNETAELEIYNQYREEIKDFIFNKLASV